MIKLTNNELEKISELRGTTRYELIEKLADVLKLSVGDNMRFTKCSKCVTTDEGTKIDIMTKKIKDGTRKIIEINVFGINYEWDTYRIK